MQKRRWFVRHFKLLQQSVLPVLQVRHPILQLGTLHAIDDGFDDLLNLPLDALQLALGAAQTGPLLHPESVHLPGELAAELLEEVLPHQLVLQGAEHPLLDLMPRDRQLVGACPAIASAKASELLARIDDEAGAAFAALRETREKVLGAPELVEAPAFLAAFPFALNTCVPRLYCLPDFVVDDAQLGHVLRDPLRRRIHPGDTLAGVWILQEPLPVPYQTADVQFVVENADATLRISVNRARAPERSTWASDTFGVESLRDLFR